MPHSHPPHVHERNTLSFGDALFLNLERPGMPLHVASLATFEGAISLDDCLAYIASKLPLIPRYRQRVVPAPWNLGLPAWQFDPSFDLRNHIRQVTLRRGTIAELKAAASRILSVPLDRARPLWDMTLFCGLDGDRTGVLTRVHHCLADGLSGVGLMHLVMDPAPTSLPPGPHRLPPQAPPAPAQSLLDCVLESCFSTVDRVLTAHSELLEVAQRLMKAMAPTPANGSGLPLDSAHPEFPPLDGWDRFVPELLSPADRLPFNLVCRGPQKYECAQIPLAALKQIKHHCGVTLNDVVLALITSVLRQYSAARGVKLGRRSLRIVMPVSVRAKGEMQELGNRITFVPVNVPMRARSLRATVAAVHRSTALLKSAHVGELVGFAGTVLGTIPPPLQAAIAPIASQLPLSVANLICTNVPGPKQPLYLLEHKMLSCHPYVPIGGEMGLNIAVLSYDGVVYFGFTGNSRAVPELAKLPRLLASAFADLKKELRLATPRRRPAPAPTERSTKPDVRLSPAGPSTVSIGRPEEMKNDNAEKEQVFAMAVGA